MKKLISIFAVVAMFCTMMMMSSAEASEPVNILGDQGDPANIEITNDQSLIDQWWYWLQNGMVIPDDASYSIVDGVKADGSTGKLYQVAHPTPCTGWTKYIVSAENLKPNTKYRFQAWVKVDGDTFPSSTGQGSWLSAGPASAAKNATKLVPLGTADANVWKLMKLDFTTPETPRDVHLLWQFEATGGTSWAYDFKLIEWYEGIDDESSEAPVSSTAPTSSTKTESTVNTGASSSNWFAGIVAIASLTMVGSVLVYATNVSKKRRNNNVI